jgi:hypothetical protein
MIPFKRNVASSEKHRVPENLITVNFLQHFLTISLSAVTIGWFHVLPAICTHVNANLCVERHELCNGEDAVARWLRRNACPMLSASSLDDLGLLVVSDL